MPKLSATQPSTHAHQFDDAAQQRDAATFGMWVFLATEVLFFGGMFLGYTAYRLAYPAAFAEASRHTLIAFGARTPQCCSSAARRWLSPFARHVSSGGRHWPCVCSQPPDWACFSLASKVANTREKFLSTSCREAHSTFRNPMPPRLKCFSTFIF